MANEHAIQATGTFVVSKGFRLLTKLAASQGSLQFTRAAVGTGKPPEGYSPESMIGLNAYKIDAEIADYGVQDDMAYITVQVSSDNVTEGFLVTEVGVFAEDPDEGEILYGYMDISTDPTYIYANGSTNRSKFAEFTLYVLVGSVSNVIAAVTPGSIITRDTFTAANLKAIDTHGILGGEAGAGTTGQGLIDAIANKLLTEFVTNTVLMERLGTYVLKSKIVNDFLSTDEETVLSGPMGKLLKEQLNVLNTKILELKSYTNEIKYRSYQTVIPIQESWIDGNICNIPFDITTALMTDKPYIFYVLPCSVIGHQVRYDYDLSTSTVAIVSIEFGAQLIAGNNVRFGIFIAGI